MTADPLGLRATPDRLRRAGQAAGLSDAALERVLDLGRRTPPASEWQKFLSIALALLGAGMLVAGAVCFIAYNWDQIGRFGKFGLVGIAIVAATLMAWRKLPRRSGEVALLVAATLVGPLLALYGQTYQTGADPYGLFLTWFVLIAPWVLVSRWAPLWVVALALLDVALALYAAQVLEYPADHYVPVAIAVLQCGAVAAWEWQARRAQPWLHERWAPRLAAAIAFAALLIPAIDIVLEATRSGPTGVIGLAGLVGAIAAAFYYYRRRRPDHFMLTIAVVAGMVWVTVLLGRLVLDVADLEAFGLFLMAAFVVWEITIGVRWYRRAS